MKIVNLRKKGPVVEHEGKKIKMPFDCKIYPEKSVEVKIDDGPWRRAQLSARNTKYSWKLWSFDWDNPDSGEHTIVSRVTDVNGNIQPANEELPEKVSFWEDFGQFPRQVTI